MELSLWGYIALNAAVVIGGYLAGWHYERRKQMPMTEWRVFKDGEGDLWFEVEPDRFSWGFNRADALERARRARARNQRLHNLDELNRMFFPLTDLTGVQ